MKLTIIPDDQTVTIDGERFAIDCADLVAQRIHAVQWDGVRGHIEFRDADDGNKPANELIESVARFQPLIDAWHDAKGIKENPPPPAPLSLEAAKASALRRINARCAVELKNVKEGYPGDEVQSWAKQEAEARAYTADTAAPTPLLSAMSEARGVPLDELVLKVIEKADLFAVVSGRIIGTRQACEDAIMAAQEAEEALAVTWPEPEVPEAPEPEESPL